MHAWTEVEIPTHDELVTSVRIFDSASESLHELLNDGVGTMYVCGITPYDATHMGHAATYVAFDTLNRLWRASGATVKYAQNVTDIDDPLLERANALGRNWEEIALEQTQLFRQDMEALRVIPPSHYIGAVESIPLVVEQIQKLTEFGCVYEVDGDLYYDTSKTDMVGSIAHLSQLDMLDLFASRGGDPNRDGKRSRLDPLLWRHERPNDPSWPSELGAGRPGWHIECAAIAVEYLGPTIDVQGGGSDLKFPHHEMSAAHAQSATGHHPFAKSFMHTGMVWLDGHKMSKSRGNLVFVSTLRNQGTDPMAIRLAILSHHYRTDWHWSDELLASAQHRLQLWRSAFASTTHASDVSDQIALALSNDLDTPTACAIIDQWATETMSASHHGRCNLPATIDALLGII